MHTVVIYKCIHRYIPIAYKQGGWFLMANAVKRTKTKYTGIYFNENTKKYDIK